MGWSEKLNSACTDAIYNKKVKKDFNYFELMYNRECSSIRKIHCCGDSAIYWLEWLESVMWPCFGLDDWLIMTSIYVTLIPVIFTCYILNVYYTPWGCSTRAQSNVLVCGIFWAFTLELGGQGLAVTNV